MFELLSTIRIMYRLLDFNVILNCYQKPILIYFVVLNYSTLSVLEFSVWYIIMLNALTSQTEYIVTPNSYHTKVSSK